MARFESKLKNADEIVSAFVRGNGSAIRAAAFLSVHPATVRASVRRMDLGRRVREASLAQFSRYEAGGALRSRAELDGAWKRLGVKGSADFFRVTVAALEGALIFHEIVPAPEGQAPARRAKSASSSVGRLLPKIGYELVPWDGWTACSVDGRPARRDARTRRERTTEPPLLEAPRDGEAPPRPTEGRWESVFLYWEYAESARAAAEEARRQAEVLRAKEAEAAREAERAASLAREAEEKERAAKEEPKPVEKKIKKRTRFPHAKGNHRIDLDADMFGEILSEAKRLCVFPEELVLEAVRRFRSRG